MDREKDVLLKAKPEPLDFKDPRNYRLYLTGMAVEVAAVLVLCLLAGLIAFAGFHLWR